MAQPLVKKDDDRDGESIVSLIHSTTMVEATEVIFSVTKLFQSKDIGLRIMVYLIIKELSPSADEMLRIAEMPKLGFDLVVLLARRHELMIMDLGEKLRKFLKQTSWCGNLGLHLLWLIIHFFVGIWYFLSGIAHALESFLISSGFLKRYKTLNVSKIHHLAVAIDCEEARETSKVLELLQFLATIGVKNISLYDSEGVLKQSKEAIKEELSCIKFYEGNSLPTSLLHKYTNLEFVSLADGKHAMGKAANFLFVKHYAGTNLQKHTLTESDVTDALRVIGCGGSDPDLLLVYASARCHLGFPAWRLRYTEIVHMGPLKSMKFGSLVKAIYKFTMIHQNYGI